MHCGHTRMQTRVKSTLAQVPRRHSRVAVRFHRRCKHPQRVKISNTNRKDIMKCRKCYSYVGAAWTRRTKLVVAESLLKHWHVLLKPLAASSWRACAFCSPYLSWHVCAHRQRARLARGVIQRRAHCRHWQASLRCRHWSHWQSCCYSSTLVAQCLQRCSYRPYLLKHLPEQAGAVLSRNGSLPHCHHCKHQQDGVQLQDAAAGEYY